MCQPQLTLMDDSRRGGYLSPDKFQLKSVCWHLNDERKMTGLIPRDPGPKERLPLKRGALTVIR
jgi:hypothetical protein